MVQGKARLARTRALSQSWFDDALIDEFVHGEPRDPLDDREVRVVYGAPRLVECVSGRVAAESTRIVEDDSGVWVAPRFEIAELPALRRPTPPAIVEPDSVLVPFKLSPAMPVGTEARRPAKAAVSLEIEPAARWARSLQLAPRMNGRETGRRFDWVRFFGGVCAGGLAAAVLIAVVTGS